VHALISSRVDYCNSVLYGVCEVHLRSFQSVLNAAARLITGKRKFDHIASTMHDDLHWLPVQQHILFKLCTLVNKCLRCTAPSYLTDMCIPVSTASGRLCLRSCSRRDLRIPHSRLSRYGSRSFSVSGPTGWNSLPTALRDLSSSSCFCRRLKTELFSRAYGVNYHIRDCYLLLESGEHKLSY